MGNWISGFGLIGEAEVSQLSQELGKEIWGRSLGCTRLCKASSSQVVFVAKWELFASLCIYIYIYTHIYIFLK